MDAVTGDQERAIEACRRAWADAEREGPAPQYVRDIITLDYADVAAQILSADEAAIRNLVNALYAGDAIVMRGAFDKAFFDGHFYSDKVFGLSLLGVAPYAVLKGALATIGREPGYNLSGCSGCREK